jgi:chromosome segregation ATPase
VNTTIDGVKSEIEAARQEIDRINESIDGWNREVSEGRAEPSAYAFELTKAARDKAAIEMRIFDLEGQLRDLEQDDAGTDSVL